MSGLKVKRRPLEERLLGVEYQTPSLTVSHPGGQSEFAIRSPCKDHLLGGGNQFDPIVLCQHFKRWNSGGCRSRAPA